MKNLIEYLMIFAVTLFFCSSNYYSFIYIGVAAFLSLFYLLVYYFKVRKGRIKKEKYQIDLSVLVVCLMIATINLVNLMEFSNLIFGAYVSAILFLSTLALAFQKEEMLKKRIFQTNYLFDFYTIIYLCNLIMELLSYEV